MRRPARMMKRDLQLDLSRHTVFDVAIVGGGINGACLYDRLCREGLKVVLLEKNDFASGTSQASGMMIWGGLLYLKKFHVGTVRDLSVSRERIIRSKRDWISPGEYHFFPAGPGLLGRTPALAGLYVYWALGSFNRSRPRRKSLGSLPGCINRGGQVLSFEEGELRPSDSRFVLHWVTRHHNTKSIALNHAELVSGGFGKSDGLWKLDIKDMLKDREGVVQAKMVVNCAGVWSDAVNRTFGINSPLKHVFSKGVYLLFDKMEERDDRLIFMMDGYDDVITSLPWGPVEMWGPTEEMVADIECGFRVTPGDLSFLLAQREKHFVPKQTEADIVGLRCGVRPLPVPVTYSGETYPLNLSRSLRITISSEVPWITAYGGKLTGCIDAANKIAGAVRNRLSVERERCDCGEATEQAAREPEWARFPGLADPVPAVGWCRDNEYCFTLDSYLRRRTNISQWVPRCGLGRNGENTETLRQISLELFNGDEKKASHEVAGYIQKVRTQYDAVLNGKNGGSPLC